MDYSLHVKEAGTLVRQNDLVKDAKQVFLMGQPFNLDFGYRVSFSFSCNNGWMVGCHFR
jgi:hypothetical protein